jgi:hypothetical protein
MNIFQVRNPDGLDLIEEHLLGDNALDKEQVSLWFRKLMVTDPEICCFLVAVEGEEPVSFIMAYADPAVDHVFIQQAWAKNGVSPAIPDNMFFRLVTWSHTINRDTIMMETKRNYKLFERRWGFELSHYVLQFNIPQDYERKFHELHKAVIGKESNGTVKNFNEVHSLGTPEESSQSTPTLFDFADRSGDGEVHRGESSPSDAGDATSTGGVGRDHEPEPV